jgi:copper transport protein
MRRGAVLLILLVAWAVLTQIANAHSELLVAAPEPGAELTESPAEIRLTFSEPVGASSQIILLADGFQLVEGVTAQVDPARPEDLFAPLPALLPGVYTVQWTAASADEHAISGSYAFSYGVGSQVGFGIDPAGAGWWVAALALILLGVLLLRRVRRS